MIDSQTHMATKSENESAYTLHVGKDRRPRSRVHVSIKFKHKNGFRSGCCFFNCVVRGAGEHPQEDLSKERDK